MTGTPPNGIGILPENVIREALVGVAPNDPTMWEEAALAALDALVAERDEWKAKYHAENLSWTSLYESERALRADLEEEKIQYDRAIERNIDLAADRDRLAAALDTMISRDPDFGARDEDAKIRAALDAVESSGA